MSPQLPDSGRMLKSAAGLPGNSLTDYVNYLFQEHATELERKGAFPSEKDPR